MAPLQDDQYEGEHFEGRDFPSEAEWLQLGGPSSGNAAGNAAGNADAGDAAELEVSNDFVDRTLRALRGRAAGAHGNDGGAELPAGLLHAYAPPEPSIDFVARTVSALHAD